MNKLVLPIVLPMALIAASFTAQAGIKDKKAKKVATTTMDAALAKAKTSCGNAKLEGKIDWSSWGSYKYEKMSGGRAKDVVIHDAGTLLEGVISEMADLCKDADYKEELAKITTIAVSGKKDQSSMYVGFKLDGATLKMDLNADAIGSWKNKDLLKKIWE
ncbi:hypothetical protein MNBD_GAMMA11-2514 [hydrothermal vent metagenome]|uniref:Uncharacterized protein n=1 Tax=hydrothermal vent metagenome TaxID=652676 RepID=A0A3B0X233_9ZZZZ